MWDSRVLVFLGIVCILLISDCAEQKLDWHSSSFI